MSEGERAAGTAVITGASAGIGAEFARQLAERGYDLLLIARREERLTELCRQLSGQFKINCEVFPADLSQEADIDLVAVRIGEIADISMLINNAGFGARGFFAEANFNRQIDMLNVHIMATVKLTRAALEKMMVNGRGDIINVSSAAGFLTGPGSVNYCATKAYLISFSQSLRGEVKDRGIRVQVLCPGYTLTEFHEVGELKGFDRSRIPKFMWQPAGYVVRESLKGLDRNRPICIPGAGYRVLLGLVRMPFVGAILKALARRIRRQ